jgi:hypothetical protein
MAVVDSAIHRAGAVGASELKPLTGVMRAAAIERTAMVWGAIDRRVSTAVIVSARYGAVETSWAYDVLPLALAVVVAQNRAHATVAASGALGGARTTERDETVPAALAFGDALGA